MNYPSGKGFFIWQIQDLYKGDPLAIATQALGLGLSWVSIKIADGTVKYNRRWTLLGWKDDLLGPLVTALRGVGISVWGWQYLYGRDPIGEADVAAERVNQLNLDGLLLDPEQEYKAAGNASAQVYMRQLKSDKGIGTQKAIGLCTYRFPSVQPDFPWDGFLDLADFHCPQVYWVGADNPADQLERSVHELTALKPVPVIPAGAAYREHGWQPTPEQVEAFDAKVHALKLPGVIYWEWANAIKCGLEKTVGKLAGDDVPITPPLAPVPPPAPGLKRYRVIADVLTIRSGGGISNPAIGYLTKANPVDVAEIVAGWARLTSPLAGWVNAKYLEAVA